MADRLLTLRDVAARCAVSIGTAKKWAREGLLPVVRLGRLVRVREEALEEFLAAREVRTMEQELRRIIGS